MSKSKIIVTFVMSCIYSCCVAQSVVVDAYLHPLEVKNKTVIDILNTLDNEIGECVFVEHGFPYCYGILLTSSYPEKASISFYTIQNYFIHSPYVEYGYFYFKDKIVLVEKSDVKCNLYEKWFERKEKIDTIHFERPTTKVFFTPGSCNGIEQVRYTYQYNHDSLVLVEAWHCSQIEKYYHHISSADTSWQQIADLYRVSLDSLKNKNKQSLFKKNPKKGKFVRIY